MCCCASISYVCMYTVMRVCKSVYEVSALPLDKLAASVADILVNLYVCVYAKVIAFACAFIYAYIHTHVIYIHAYTCASFFYIFLRWLHENAL